VKVFVAREADGRMYSLCERDGALCFAGDTLPVVSSSRLGGRVRQLKVFLVVDFSGRAPKREVIGPGDFDAELRGVMGDKDRQAHGRGEERFSSRGGLGCCVVVCFSGFVDLVELVVAVVVGALTERCFVRDQEASQVPLGGREREHFVGVGRVRGVTRARPNEVKAERIDKLRADVLRGSHILSWVRYDDNRISRRRVAISIHGTLYCKGDGFI
jgi:hypothetical protein